MIKKIHPFLFNHKHFHKTTTCNKVVKAKNKYIQAKTHILLEEPLGLGILLGEFTLELGSLLLALLHREIDERLYPGLHLLLSGRWWWRGGSGEVE